MLSDPMGNAATVAEIGQTSFLNIFSNVASSVSNSGISSYHPPENFYLLFIFLTTLSESGLSGFERPFIFELEYET